MGQMNAVAVVVVVDLRLVQQLVVEQVDVVVVAQRRLMMLTIWSSLLLWLASIMTMIGLLVLLVRFQ